jgi:hypothetical protein
MNQVLECNGGWDYRIEHMNKKKVGEVGFASTEYFGDGCGNGLGWLGQ